jgi:hypothetical protein
MQGTTEIAVLAATAFSRLAQNHNATLLKSAKPYGLMVGWKCSSVCGKPIRFGDLCVTTSPDLKPWERAHAACLQPRKGSDGDRVELTDEELQTALAMTT